MYRHVIPEYCERPDLLKIVSLIQSTYYNGAFCKYVVLREKDCISPTACHPVGRRESAKRVLAAGVRPYGTVLRRAVFPVGFCVEQSRNGLHVADLTGPGHGDSLFKWHLYHIYKFTVGQVLLTTG